MISGKQIAVHQITEVDPGRGIIRTLIVQPKHLNTPLFTLEQEAAIYEMCSAFLSLNRRRGK